MVGISVHGRMKPISDHLCIEAYHLCIEVCIEAYDVTFAINHHILNVRSFRL